jgi:hypothetical protein
MRGMNRSVITAAGFVLQIALAAVYAWSVFRIPLARQFGWSIPEVTLTFTISIFVLGVSAFFGGFGAGALIAAPGATQWTMKNVVSRAEILARLERRYGRITAVASDGSAPASRFLLSDGSVFGIIASTTEPFCSRCDRSRLTAGGIWYRCLYAMAGTDLRRMLRGAAGPDEIAGQIADLIGTAWRGRTDRGAEQRKANHGRSAFVPLGALQCDPHFEMHIRGG